MSEKEVQGFNYSIIPAAERDRVKTKTTEIRVLVRQTAQGIIEIGQRLIEIKAALPHGQWLPWLEAEFGWSENTARNFMRVAGLFKSATVADLDISPRALYLLSAPSTPGSAREEAIEKAKSGEEVTYTDAQRLVDAHRQIEDQKQKVIDLESQINDLQSQLPTQDVIDKISELSAALEAEKRKPAEQVEIEVPPEDYEKVKENLKNSKKAIKDLTDKYENLSKKLIPKDSLPKKQFKTIVIDPPWPVKKIIREKRPKQDVFSYPTMTTEEIADIPLQDLIHADGTHLYLWTTQKYLPHALRIARAWGFKYQCLLTWVKSVGFTPYSWMYSTEHVLFATAGGLKLLKNGKRLDFAAKTREHSRKPDEFYDLVKEVSPSPRIEIFSREQREGFEQFGNEKSKFR